MEEKDPDDLLKEAIGRLEQAYHAHLTDLAKCFFFEVKQGRVTTREEADRWIYETVDGDGWVIYTRKAQAVLLCSSNDGAGMEDGVVESTGGLPWSQLAYHAMHADLLEEIYSLQEDHGVDLDEDDLGIEYEDEDEEPESDPSP